MKNDRRQDFKVGSIYFELQNTILEDSLKTRLNFGGQLGECEVWVYSNEGNVPHVHVVSKNGKFETCVCLTTNKHFTHGKYKDKFTNVKQRKAFDDFMGAPSKEDPTRTNWQLSCLLWNVANGSKMEIHWQKMNKPDYRLMNDEAIKG